jgi:uncharacterized phage-associated protein
MRTNAISVANYFIDLAQEQGVELKQLGLIKRVYLTHGFSLAMLNESAIDPRFDVVEAWKNGPVIPSVYHSFKHNANNPIREKSFFISGINGDDAEFTTPKLDDADIIEITRMVWGRYKKYSDGELVSMLHKKGTPWDLCYEEGRNNEIPDLYTKTFYGKLVEAIRNSMKKEHV